MVRQTAKNSKYNEITFVPRYLYTKVAQEREHIREFLKITKLQ